MSLAVDRADSLSQLSVINHGFFHRTGGVSSGLFDSLNCGYGSGDELARVAENRGRVADWLGVKPQSLLTAKQVHSAKVVTVTEAWPMPSTAAPEADAMVTNRAGFALGILTADCAPLLFCDPEAGVIGAAHAGWKGAIGGVAEATIKAMTELGAATARIRIAIGPSIAQSSYEVGPEFRDRFIAEDPLLVCHFIDSSRVGYFKFDLGGFLRARLSGLGLASVEVLGHDTCANPADYFSYRRSCLNGEGSYGRLISAISLL
ncbi:MAG: peptidoglycan editing factor PgeF [Candidatus Pacebacteria bacterium]|nr:peptidoglycan editing factor PgeF [Candidatus Paceibacterota bacterium]